MSADRPRPEESPACATLRVAVVLDHFDPAKGGMEDALFRLASFLGDRGHELHLFAIDWNAMVAGVMTTHRIDVSGSRASREARFARLAVAAGRECADVVVGLRHSPGVDVYYPHGGLYRDTRRAGDRARGKLEAEGRRWLAAVSPKQRVFARAEEALLRDRHVQWIAVSEHVRRRFLAHGVDDERITVAANGVDAERFQVEDAVRATRAQERGRAVEFLYVAHNHRLKGLAWLLRATHRLLTDSRADVTDAASLRDRLRLVIVGRDAEDHGSSLARRLGVLEHCRFVGVEPDMAARYRAADVFVLPTHHDPCSLATLEAMASAMPVITTACNGAIDGAGLDAWTTVGARVIDRAENVEALAAAMRELLDGESRLAAGRRAAEHARRRTWSSCFAAVERVLLESAARK